MTDQSAKQKLETAIRNPERYTIDDVYELWLETLSPEARDFFGDDSHKGETWVSFICPACGGKTPRKNITPAVELDHMGLLGNISAAEAVDCQHCGRVYSFHEVQVDFEGEFDV